METTEKKHTLFDITEDLLALNDLLEEVGGDLSDPSAAAAVDEWMQTIGQDQNTKLESYGYLIRKLEMEAAAANEEAERFKMKARTRTTRIGYLKQRLRLHMDTIGAKKIETPAFTFAIQANGGKCAITVTSEDLVPLAYKKCVWTVNPDNVREGLEAGEEIPGVQLEPRGTSLRIR